MNKTEIAEIERLQAQIVALSPGQIEVLRAWIISCYDVRGAWMAHNYDDVRGFDFLKKGGTK